MRCRVSLARDRMKLEMNRFIGFKVKECSMEASIFDQFDAGKCWAEADFERAPMTDFAQSGAEATGSVPEKSDSWKTREQTALAQDKIGVEVANDGLLDLREFVPNGFFGPQEGQRGGVVAEEQHTLIRL